MKRIYEGALALIEPLCRADNEDIAGLNWLQAGRLAVDLLSPALRRRFLKTQSGRQLQAKLWDLWLQRNSNLREDPEETLPALADAALVGRIAQRADGDIRCIRLLGRIALPEAKQALQNLIPAQDNPQLLGEIIAALGDTTAASEAVQRLKEMLAQSGSERNAALMALGRANTPQSATVLIEYLETGGGGKTSDALKLLSNPAVSGVVIAHLRLESPPALAEVLGRVGGLQAAAHIRALLAQAEQMQPQNRGNVIPFMAMCIALLKALANIPGASSVEILQNVAQGQQWADECRYQAVEALAGMRFSGALRAWLRLLEDPALPARFRYAAAEAAPAPLPPSAEEELLAIFRRGSDFEPETAALLAAALKRAQSPQGVQILLRLLQFPDANTQNQAAISLGILQAEEALEILLPLIRARLARGEDADDLIRSAGAMKSRQAADLMADLLQNPAQMHVWNSAALALAETGDPDFTRPLLQADTALRALNKPPAARKEILGALAALGSAEASRYLLTLAAEDAARHPLLWRSIFRRFQGDASVPLLQAGLSAADPELRALCAIALGELKRPAALPPLLKALCSQDEAVRKAAIEGVDAFSCPLNNPSLALALARAMTAPCIATLKGIASTPKTSLRRILERVRGEAEEAVCRWAINVLQQNTTGSTEALQLLGGLYCEGGVPLLGDCLRRCASPGQRREAARGLDLFGTENAFPYLLQALQEERDPEVLAAVQRALKQPQYLCLLLEHFDLCRDILIALSREERIRIFPDGRVAFPGDALLPCREAMETPL